MNALDHSRNQGVRLLIVQAKKEAFDFYDKCGFDFTLETKSEQSLFRNCGTRTMYFDVMSLKFLQT